MKMVKVDLLNLVFPSVQRKNKLIIAYVFKGLLVIPTALFIFF